MDLAPSVHLSKVQIDFLFRLRLVIIPLHTRSFQILLLKVYECLISYRKISQTWCSKLLGWISCRIPLWPQMPLYYICQVYKGSFVDNFLFQNFVKNCAVFFRSDLSKCYLTVNIKIQTKTHEQILHSFEQSWDAHKWSDKKFLITNMKICICQSRLAGSWFPGATYRKPGKWVVGSRLNNTCALMYQALAVCREDCCSAHISLLSSARSLVSNCDCYRKSVADLSEWHYFVELDVINWICRI